MTMSSGTGLLSQMIERGLVAGSCRWSERARGFASPAVPVKLVAVVVAGAWLACAAASRW
jgi:hypothetical protein